MKYFHININEDNWCIYLVDDNDGVVISEGSAAETDFRNKEMHFRRGEITFLNVKHEMTHAYFGYLYLADTHGIEIADIEEIICAFVADRGQKILDSSNVVYNMLKEIRDASKD